jgi:hypothetical protein
MGVRPAAPLLATIVAAYALLSPPSAAQPQLAVFFGNLHSHTALSDGSGTPAEAYEHARDRAELDFIALTEHNHAQAGDIAGNHALYTGPGSLALIPTAQRFLEVGEFLALYGQEFSTISGGNHMNVIDAPQVIDVGNGDFRTLFESWLPDHPDTLGLPPLLILNHPSTSGSPGGLEYGIDDYDGDVDEWLAAIDPRAELINIINGPSHTEGTNQKPGKPSESEFKRYLNLGLHVAPTADQDNHKKNWGNATDARTGVIAPALTKAALLTALRQRRAYATEDRNLRLVYQVNGQLLGGRITGAAVPPQGTALSISLQITDDDEPAAGYVVEVFSDQIGGPVAGAAARTQSVAGNGTHAISGLSYDGGDQYLYLRIRQDDGNRAWTAPVWLEPGGVPDVIEDGDGDEGGGSSSFNLSLAVDERAETAVITNAGTAPVELTGWTLVSVKGNQVFDQFPEGTSVGPGQTITVTSGPGARTGAGFLRWTNQSMWSNSGDPGRLIDGDGNVVAED